MRYLIVIEQTATGHSALSPDLPCCVVTGATREAIAFHLDGLREDGLALPQPTSYSTYIEVAA